MKTKINFAIFASYNASSLDTIYKAIKNKEIDINIALVITNNSNANAIAKAEKLNIPCYVINDKNSSDVNEAIINKLEHYNCSHVFLSGYMKKISSTIANKYTIINTHPALLPKYGGAGMYGSFVHEAVIKNDESKSGVTIHYVNEKYDDGEIIFQDSLDISENETAKTLETKIKALEQNSIVKALKICLK